jgi:hypothetical protein
MLPNAIGDEGLLSVGFGSYLRSWFDCFDASYSSYKPVVDETETESKKTTL